MEAGATSSRKEARGAKLVRRLLALLGRDQAAVGVGVDLERCSPPRTVSRKLYRLSLRVASLMTDDVYSSIGDDDG